MLRERIQEHRAALASLSLRSPSFSFLLGGSVAAAAAPFATARPFSIALFVASGSVSLARAALLVPLLLALTILLLVLVARATAIAAAAALVTTAAGALAGATR